MKEIIFWFSNNNIKKYWFNYIIKFLNEFNNNFKVNRNNYWIELFDIKINFKNDIDELSHIGVGNINQYWVEDLFDNNFKCFLKEILQENLNYG